MNGNTGLEEQCRYDVTLMTETLQSTEDLSLLSTSALYDLCIAKRDQIDGSASPQEWGLLENAVAILLTERSYATQTEERPNPSMTAEILKAMNMLQNRMKHERKEIDSAVRKAVKHGHDALEILVKESQVPTDQTSTGKKKSRKAHRLSNGMALLDLPNEEKMPNEHPWVRLARVMRRDIYSAVTMLLEIDDIQPNQSLHKACKEIRRALTANDIAAILEQQITDAELQERKKKRKRSLMRVHRLLQVVGVRRLIASETAFRLDDRIQQLLNPERT